MFAITTYRKYPKSIVSKAFRIKRAARAFFRDMRITASMISETA